MDDLGGTINFRKHPMGGIEYFAACVFDARLAQHTCIESCAALTTEGLYSGVASNFPHCLDVVMNSSMRCRGDIGIGVYTTYDNFFLSQNALANGHHQQKHVSEVSPTNFCRNF